MLETVVPRVVTLEEPLNKLLIPLPRDDMHPGRSAAKGPTVVRYPELELDVVVLVV
jgi:hypothetical protein